MLLNTATNYIASEHVVTKYPLISLLRIFCMIQQNHFLWLRLTSNQPITNHPMSIPHSTARSPFCTHESPPHLHHPTATNPHVSQHHHARTARRPLHAAVPRWIGHFQARTRVRPRRLAHVATCSRRGDHRQRDATRRDHHSESNHRRCSTAVDGESKKRRIQLAACTISMHARHIAPTHVYAAAACAQTRRRVDTLFSTHAASSQSIVHARTQVGYSCLRHVVHVSCVCRTAAHGRSVRSARR